MINEKKCEVWLIGGPRMRLGLVEQKVSDVKVIWCINVDLLFELQVWKQGRLGKISWNENETDLYVVLPNSVE